MNAVSPELGTPNTQKTLEDLLWVCTALCELLTIENAALTKHDAKTVHELTENKNALGKLYEKTLQQMGKGKEIKNNIGQDDLKTLYQLGAQMHGLMQKNAIMLRAEIEARKRVMEVFVNAAKEHNKNTIHYSKKGKFLDLPVSREHAALAYNKTL